MKLPLKCLTALLLAPLAAIAAPPVSLDSLLNEMVDVESIARWPQAEFTCRQASSYDRAKVAPDKPGWFANNDNTQYIRAEDNEGRKEQVMMSADGPGALVRFWLTVGGQKGGVLRIYLDGDASPALTFPAFDLLQGDLKVGAPLAQPHPGYAVHRGGGNNLYFPIPYAKATLHATTSPWAWDNRSMHFHDAWHHESGLKTPPVSDWNFIRISGRGVYAGDSLAIFNPVSTWYGEGDEKIWVDGESFPSHMGTGTEDYYGYSYAPKPVHQTPFSNLVRIDQPMTQGWNVMSRTRHLDGIPFRQSLQFDIELMSWKPMTPTYAATTYWYAFPGATSSLKPQPKDAALPVPTLAEVQAQPPQASAPVSAPLPSRKPGAVECETMKVVARSGDFFVGEQDMKPFGAERWSNGLQLLGKSAASGEFVDIEFRAPDAAPRKLLLYATQAPDYATLGFQVNGQKVPAAFDGYADSVRPAPVFPLGVFAPRDGKFRLRAEVVGANPAAKDPKYFFGLDCVILEQP